jgi:hypothetical protein
MIGDLRQSGVRLHPRVFTYSFVALCQTDAPITSECIWTSPEKMNKTHNRFGILLGNS